MNSDYLPGFFLAKFRNSSRRGAGVSPNTDLPSFTKWKFCIFISLIVMKVIGLCIIFGQDDRRTCLESNSRAHFWLLLIFPTKRSFFWMLFFQDFGWAFCRNYGHFVGMPFFSLGHRIHVPTDRSYTIQYIIHFIMLFQNVQNAHAYSFVYILCKTFEKGTFWPPLVLPSSGKLWR